MLRFFDLRRLLRRLFLLGFDHIVQGAQCLLEDSFVACEEWLGLEQNLGIELLLLLKLRFALLLAFLDQFLALLEVSLKDI